MVSANSKFIALGRQDVGMPIAMRLQIEFAQQLPDAHFVVTGDALQDARQCLHPDRIMKWDHLVMFAVNPSREPYVRAALAHRFVAQSPERRLQAFPAYVAGQLHATRSSSRTK